MIPILYRADELNFRSNGLGRLSECAECTVTEERNGIYECEFKYPITGRFYQEMIANGGIVAVIHDDKKDIQPFDIYAHSAPIDGVVTFNAHHISYRLSKIIVKPFEADSAAMAMAGLEENSVVTNPFTFWTDKATGGKFLINHPSNIRSVLGGQEGSILDTFGKGDYEFDMYTVRLYQNRGVKSGVTIRYGKNITDLTHTKDTSGTFTAIAPYWTDGEGNTVTLDDYIVVSAEAPLTQMPWTDESGNIITDENGETLYFQCKEITPVPYDFSNAFEEAPTQEQLREKALQFMANNEPWLPDENITVDFVQLWQTSEYENVAALQRVGLCDTVSVFYPELGVIASETKVIKTVYNVLLERFDSMELGKVSTTLSQSITGSIESKIVEAVPTRSFIQAAVKKGTNLISGGLGGYVVLTLNADGQPQEILIMDTDDINTAVNVIRMNKNGIGFSQSGYEGPFLSAWTIDGAFNADFITAGTMLANRIMGGTLTLGGEGNGNGVARILDAEGNVISTLNNGGVITTALRSTDYIYLDAGEGSYIRFQKSPYEYFSFGVDRFTLAWDYGSMYTGGVVIGTYSPALCIRYGESLGSYSAYGFIANNCELTDISLSCGAGLSFQSTNNFLVVGESSNSADVRITGSLHVSGTKSRLADADEFGKRLLYCYETPSPMFGDTGEGVFDDYGMCYVFLDPVFAETISTAKYQVFLQSYSDSPCWVAERRPSFFVASGTPGASFGWELKAKQKGFDQLRLERDNDAIITGNDYGRDAAVFLQRLQEGKIT